jgi:hypothetical protein
MYRIEFQDGAAVAVTCDTAEEARELMRGTGERAAPSLGVFNGNGHSAKRGEKTQAIRDYLAANPDAPAPQVVAELASRGIEVSAATVHGVRGKLAQPKRKTRRGRKASA